MKVDDGLHAHRKTRAVTKSHPEKRRDAAPMGLWVLAGSWSALHATDGWVPEDELDRWDDDWPELIARLISAGYWWTHERDGEPGYGFTDWHDYNDPADMASKAGTYGNHVRWHVNEGKVDPECDHCPKEPDRGDVPPDIGAESPPDRPPISPPDSGGESRIGSGAIALPEPEPEPEPDPNPGQALPDKSGDTPDRFDEFWDTYGKKVDRRTAERRWAAALKKRGVTPDLLIAAAASYVTYERTQNQGGRFVMDPSKWLLNERWRDERTSHLALVNSQPTTSRRQAETDGLFERALARAQENDR